MNNDIFEIEEREETAPSTAASSNAGTYDDNAIQTLKWNEHIRRRPGMYIGKLGDGTHSDDGIYVLIKEVVDNSIDEFNMGAGKRIDITLTEEGEVMVRDYGRGIPLGKVKEVASDINTGGKFDDKNFKKSVGLNGVGLKAVNALSTYCHVASVRDGKKVEVEFERGDLIRQSEPIPTDEPNGTLVRFTPDPTLFQNYRFNQEFVETMVNNYTYLNAGLQLFYNGRKYYSRHGLLDLLRENMTNDPLYPIIHLSGEDIEVVLTHTDQYGEEYYSFVNGQHTTQGGTHLTAFREHVTRTIKEFSGKGYEFSDIRNGLVAAVSVRIQEPVFESQTKTKLGSKEVAPGSSLTVNKFIGDFIKKELDDYLHRNPDIAEIMLRKIASSEKERKAMAGVAKLAREKAKKVSLHNRKLRDCRVHYNDPLKAKAKEDRREDSAIFITEGDSASGTITKVRNAETQAVFSLRGKPLNSYGMTQEVVYKNDEFNLLQAALNIEEGIEGLRYNKVIIATDADVDGMHIRLLIITFFLMFFPDLVKKGHVYILQTPLFRVRDKNAVRRTKKKNRKKEETEGEKDTFYCYTDEEREAAIARFGNNAEITRFKGLGEINDAEFAEFIGPDMRLDRVKLKREDAVEKLLEFYMGKNTMERQNFIIDNLVIEDDSEI
ncbi:DNA topoisomerase IV subunit B [Sangeribacter muris]|jgi:topoisomerase-4 subunit B|uniref:DNA topoisomerase IV subunit B n=1 Tax=Sangeribacter muris TaxID=2880703 RepID=UPI000F519C69|nr:DNA topoisomerase IV subunit B [Sangeribacter muris]ROS83788.1 type IIA DNA topoisomerase subunit B [Muribaculaceae bacterium Isolate-036 (Harlan)]